MYVAAQGFTQFVRLATLCAVLAVASSWSAAARCDGLLMDSVARIKTSASAATLTARAKTVMAGHSKKTRRKVGPLPLSLSPPTLSFASTVPGGALPFNRSTVEPAEPARFRRFGASLLPPLDSGLANSNDYSSRDEPFRIGFSPEWNLRWDLSRGPTPATNREIGVNIGLQRRF